MSYSHLFKDDHIVTDLKSVEKKSALEELIDTAIERGYCPKSKKKSIFDSLLSREKLGSTGLGHGVAIPHVKVDGFSDQISMIARSTSGVEFNAVDGEPVYILFFLVSSTNSAEEHLSILQWISRMARHQDFGSFVRKAKDAKEIFAIIKEIGE